MGEIETVPKISYPDMSSSPISEHYDDDDESISRLKHDYRLKTDPTVEGLPSTDRREGYLSQALSTLHRVSQEIGFPTVGDDTLPISTRVIVYDEHIRNTLGKTMFDLGFIKSRSGFDISRRRVTPGVIIERYEESKEYTDTEICEIAIEQTIKEYDALSYKPIKEGTDFNDPINIETWDTVRGDIDPSFRFETKNRKGKIIEIPLSSFFPEESLSALPYAFMEKGLGVFYRNYEAITSLRPDISIDLLNRMLDTVAIRYGFSAQMSENMRSLMKTLSDDRQAVSRLLSNPSFDGRLFTQNLFKEPLTPVNITQLKESLVIVLTPEEYIKVRGNTHSAGVVLDEYPGSTEGLKPRQIIVIKSTTNPDGVHHEHVHVRNNTLMRRYFAIPPIKEKGILATIKNERNARLLYLQEELLAYHSDSASDSSQDYGQESLVTDAETQSYRYFDDFLDYKSGNLKAFDGRPINPFKRRAIKRMLTVEYDQIVKDGMDIMEQMDILFDSPSIASYFLLSIYPIFEWGSTYKRQLLLDIRERLAKGESANTGSLDLHENMERLVQSRNLLSVF